MGGSIHQWISCQWSNISCQGNTNCYFGNVGQSSADDSPLPDPSLNGYKILTQNFSLLTHPDIPNCLIWMFLVPPEFLFVKPHMITIFCHELNPTRLLVNSVKSHIFCRSCKLSVSLVKSQLCLVKLSCFLVTAPL